MEVSRAIQHPGKPGMNGRNSEAPQVNYSNSPAKKILSRKKKSGREKGGN